MQEKKNELHLASEKAFSCCFLGPLVKGEHNGGGGDIEKNMEHNSVTDRTRIAPVKHFPLAGGSRVRVR